jgi:uncharacterized protein YjbJ (UPF0337 family)
MSSDERPEEVGGGLAGKLAGKAKQAAGSVLGNDELAREGRLQETQADTARDARRDAAAMR